MFSAQGYVASMAFQMPYRLHAAMTNIRCPWSHQMISKNFLCFLTPMPFHGQSACCPRPPRAPRIGRQGSRRLNFEVTIGILVCNI